MRNDQKWNKLKNNSGYRVEKWKRFLDASCMPPKVFVFAFFFHPLPSPFWLLRYVERKTTLVSRTWWFHPSYSLEDSPLLVLEILQAAIQHWYQSDGFNLCFLQKIILLQIFVIVKVASSPHSQLLRILPAITMATCLSHWLHCVVRRETNKEEGEIW